MALLSLAVFAGLFLAGIAEDAGTKTTYRILTPQELAEAPKVSEAPPDDGTKNYGDFIFEKRYANDVNLWTEVLVLPETSSEEISISWDGTFLEKNITTIRVLNIGRQRAYCDTLGVQYVDSYAYVHARIIIPALVDPRLLIEVYGYSRP